MLLRRDIERIDKVVKTVIAAVRTLEDGPQPPDEGGTYDTFGRQLRECEEELNAVIRQLQHWHEREATVAVIAARNALNQRLDEFGSGPWLEKGVPDPERIAKLRRLVDAAVDIGKRGAPLWRLRPLRDEVSERFLTSSQCEGWAVALFVAQEENFSAVRDLWRMVRHEIDELHGIRLMPYEPTKSVRGVRHRGYFRYAHDNSDERTLVHPMRTESAVTLRNERKEPFEPGGPSARRAIGYYFVPDRPAAGSSVAGHVANTLLRLAWGLSTFEFSDREGRHTTKAYRCEFVLAACPATFRFDRKERDVNETSLMTVVESDALFDLLSRMFAELPLRNSLIVHPKMAAKAGDLAQWFTPGFRVPASHRKKHRECPDSLEVAGTFRARPGDTMGLVNGVSLPTLHWPPRAVSTSPALPVLRRSPSRIALRSLVHVRCPALRDSLPLLVDYSPSGCRLRVTAASRAEAQRAGDALRQSASSNGLDVQLPHGLAWPWDTTNGAPPSLRLGTTDSTLLGPVEVGGQWQVDIRMQTLWNVDGG